ncbi:hypothetical protein [Stenotrophomonas rhizophila]|uniref:hypothetical protein n=1 Tax=Stenotrophomonas rhizophila TaxID=216778 RepID=UPI001E2F4858|nr:hypothetical protein [Stenotrophomonas rhizophila]MCC7634085.1 hypothetical protein [Stenotrophomonas rhizophila]MCC7662781.1 hypothetical protein [Stenotrophomonas rhizophila]
MRADQRPRALLRQGSTRARVFLLLAAVVVAAVGLTDRQYHGQISGGCSQVLSPFLKQAKSASPRAISFCDEHNADVAELVVGPIPPGTESMRVEIAGYGDTPGISAALIGADGSRYPVALPRAGDQWVPWTIGLPEALHSQQSTLTVTDNSKEGFGWIGVGIGSGNGGWMPVSIALLLLSVLYPFIWRVAPPLADQPARTRTRSVIVAFAVSVVTIVALVLRRPSQWSNPYIWVEDGRDLLPHFVKYGWQTLFEPVAGYILLPNKLINAIALSASFRWLPEISLALCALFTVVVILFIAMSPTRLRAPVLCAIAVLAVPTDPEVFTTSAYALWWGSLLAVVPIFWDERCDPSLRRRAPLLVVGALSSPFIVFLAPLYLARAIWLRQRSEWAMAAVAGVLAVVQATLVLINTQRGAEPHQLPGIPSLLGKFVGNYFWWSPDSGSPALAYGIGIAVLLIAAVYGLAQRHRNGLVITLVAACLVLSVVASAGRVPVDSLDPFRGGPRYFFYPYIFVSWLLIQLMVEARGIARMLLIVLLLAPIPHTFQNGQRTHERLDWRDEVRRCTNESSAEGIPIHLAGYLSLVWHSPLSADACRQLVKGSLFDNELRSDDLPPKPHP